MNYTKTYSDKDWEVIIPYKRCINHVLCNEVIPSLRKVIMEWDRQKNTISFYFYHDGPVTHAIEKHYGHIISLIHCHDLRIAVNTDYKIIQSNYPECIPQREFVIYVRKEPFIDPIDDSPPPKGDAAFYRENYVREKPLPLEIGYCEKDWEIIWDFRWYVNRALWGEVIPSLRQVSMQWDPEEKIVWILFYHDGPITDAIADHYGFIDSLADCDPREGVQTCYKIIRLDYPKPLQNDSSIIYARKEPFLDP